MRFACLEFISLRLFTYTRRLGEINSFTKHVRERYMDHFGALNQRISIANSTLVLLDAPGLVNEDYLRAGSGVSFDHWTPLKDGPIEFVTAVATGEQIS